jgi:hypothetical protein
MMLTPVVVSLEITPSARFDLINVRDRVIAVRPDLERFAQALYCSHHTTGGYLDQAASAINNFHSGLLGRRSAGRLD